MRRPRRSVLFTPATRADRWAKAVTAGKADVAVVDLEDAVAPAEKAAARKAIVEAAGKAAGRTERAVRINPWPSSDATADLEAIGNDFFELIVVPKAEDPDAVEDLESRLDVMDSSASLMLIVETARGVVEAHRLCERAERVVAMAFGAEDYAADVGARRTKEGNEVAWARSRVVASAAAQRVDAIDQVYVDLKDLAGLEAETRAAAGLGYRGKMLIHPDHIATVHRALAPSREEVARARRIVETLDARGAGEGGVVVVDGRMVDRPLVEQARRVIAWSDLPE
jgi:citrate lyase subunit beta/citryl-CoA lyase